MKGAGMRVVSLRGVNYGFDSLKASHQQRTVRKEQQ